MLGMSVGGWRSVDRSRKNIEGRAGVSDVRQGTKCGRLRFDICGRSKPSVDGLDSGRCFAGERCQLRRCGWVAVRGDRLGRRRLGLCGRIGWCDFDGRSSARRAQRVWSSRDSCLCVDEGSGGRLHGRVEYWRFVKSGRIDGRGDGERRRVRNGIGYRYGCCVEHRRARIHGPGGLGFVRRRCCGRVGCEWSREVDVRGL